MPDKKCTEHALTFQDSICLPSTDDPLMGEKLRFLNVQIWSIRNIVSSGSKNIEKGEVHNPCESILV